MFVEVCRWKSLVSVSEEVIFHDLMALRCLLKIPDLKLSLWKEVPNSKIILWERLIQRFLFQRGLHIRFLLLKWFTMQYVSFDDGNITLLPEFYFMFIFPSASSSLQHSSWKGLITHPFPARGTAAIPQPRCQWGRAGAGCAPESRAFQEKHSDNTALECLGHKSPLGILPALWTLPFSLRQFRACPIASYRGRRSTTCSGEKKV